MREFMPPEMALKEKLELLREAIGLLEDADACVQEALGASDVCYETHNRIADLIEDLEEDIYSLENPVE